MKNNNIYWITCVLDPRIKTNWLKKNYFDANEIITRIKSFLKEAYLADQELPRLSCEKSEMGKSSLEFDFLQEYRSSIITDDDIERYFNLLGVNFVLNKK